MPWGNIRHWLAKKEADPTVIDFRSANTRLFNAPVMVYVTIEKTTPEWSIYDTGAFTQNLMLSATHHGLDSMVAYGNLKYPDIIRHHMPIPDNERIVAPIALGYRSDDKINQFVNNRLPLEDILVSIG